MNTNKIITVGAGLVPARKGRPQGSPLQKIIILILALTVGWAAPTIMGGTAYALPQDGTVAAGGSTITQPDSNTMHINQSTDKSIINWQGYSIGANEKVQYLQPNSGSISLNRVTGADPSLIYGQLAANGQVWVINPNGMLIGNGANINVGSFLGSTLNINDNDFINGNYNFTGTTTSLSSITNQGNINAADGGYVVFISPTINNSGNITANSGSVNMASGDDVTLTFANNGLINLVINKATAADALGIDNSGTITANGGQVIISAKTAGDLLKTVINNTGVIQARTIENKNGVIKLLGGMENNAINVGGTLDASAPNGGDGGFIETSAASVKIADTAIITTAAANGKTGTWLIDPTDYTIAASVGDITGATLSTNLGSNNVTILSSSGATGINGDVNVNDAVSWSANTTLTLSAYRNVNVNSNITATGNTAGLTLTPDTCGGACTGTYSLNNGAVITLSGSAPSLTIAGNAYTVINDVTALQNMSSNLVGKYAIGSNIDASATSGWNAGLGFAPVGNNILPFEGAFDGLGHTITGLTINRPATTYVGLFGRTSDGIISNVGLLDVNITGNYYVGGLVGSEWYAGIISNSYSTGSVSGSNDEVGGLMGYQGFGSTISNSYSAANVNGKYDVGGLVGYNYGTISNSYATGAVSGTNNVGGLAGYNDRSNISNSYSTGAVTGTTNSSWRVGGLVGYNVGTIAISSTISNSYSAGNVTGNTSVGGLVGENYQSAISNSYSTGSVTGNTNSWDIGGLVGYNSSSTSTITNSYSTGAVSGTNDVGGLVGGNNNGNTITNSYWDTQTSGKSNCVGVGPSAGCTGLTTSEMMTQANFSGWSIANIGGSSATWRIYEGYTYPLLKSFLTPLTVTANAANKTYDGLAYTGGSGVFYSVASPTLSGTLGYSGTSQGAVNAGSYTITPGGYYSNQQGYDISYANGALTVNPAPLTVTANADSKTYNGLAYTGGNGVGYSGFVNGETSAVLGGALGYSGTSQNAINAGSYVITPGGQTSGNYTISYVDGVLTIAAASTGGTTTTTTTGGTTTNTVIAKVDYTDVIQEGLGNSGGNAINDIAAQAEKYEAVYASADSSVFTFTADGSRPLITDYQLLENKKRQQCLTIKKN